MDYRDTAEEAAWRDEVREFLRKEAPDEYAVHHRPAVDSMGLGDETFQQWRRTVADRGWLAAHWPKDYDGAGMSTMEQFIMKEEFARHRCVHPGGRGIEMVGPTIILHGTDQQKRELLPPILHGEHIYAQGFSEPGAGSDLAAVQLRAVREGDEYVLNGQKIWTSNATTCNWLFLLARSDADAPKHKGISYFVTPMDVEGLTVRTIPDMTNGTELCETFFDDVRIPASYRIGEENRGWYVAMTTLDFERSGIAGAIGIQQQILDMAADRPPFASKTGLADLYISSEVARQMSYHVASLQDRGQVPNYEASMVKLFSSEVGQRLAHARMRYYGLSGQLLGDSLGYEIEEGRVAHQVSRSLPSTIAGGSSEVQRNIIATRGLGLPRG
ncbi:MAG: acyl-CoA dehydrogenase family protein [Dehalococcoidia bacterium]|nr:acyl-CoA dehydrogenase family protein [Dehalococcoidia bacterium]